MIVFFCDCHRVIINRELQGPVLGLLCHKEQWVRKKKRSTWPALSQRVMGSKREAKYLAYFVTKSNEFEKESEVLALLCHKE